MACHFQDYRVHLVGEGVFALYAKPRGQAVPWQPVDAVEAESFEQARDAFVGRAVAGIASADLMRG